ncbi:MAG: hypothetical protein ACYTGV_13235 [Planctomycetota bacterium]|jgi:opacity protein-like surface antigen
MKKVLAVIAAAALLGGLAGAADTPQPVTIEVEIVSTAFSFGAGSGGFVLDGAAEDEGSAYLGQWSVPSWGWGWSSVWDLTLCGADGNLSLALKDGEWSIVSGSGDYAGLEGSGTYTVSRELLSATGGWWGTPLYLDTYVLKGGIEE